ncbi:single-strand binding protein [Nocardioides sp. YR527]|uniref:single-stranded DNA-binding protein n=1 Tax=Nocardioides sp. YR527 TaxID=1881028 RepID=UPI00088BA632|nr:single-stranded DNA-binding protein [Nocardioides sp. YR527]SDL15147.1 single-strand binding protein [Nocardioides sp. YR527]
MTLPTITIVGNTTGPAELRFLEASGKAVCNLTVVANKRTRNKQTNEWEDGGRSPFIRVTLWEQAAEDLAEALGNVQSAKVIVTGTLIAREYEKNGEKRESIELDYATVGIIPASTRPRGQQGQQHRPQQGQRDPWAAPPANDPWATPAPADEPPF